jgi:hypothetical protein
MGRLFPPPAARTLRPGAAELHLRMGKKIFGVSFTDLAEARDAARHINLSGRDVEIYEKDSSKVLVSLKAVGPQDQPVPAFLADTFDTGQTPELRTPSE